MTDTNSKAQVTDAGTQEYTLRAMANNYGDGPHSWDRLDKECCLKAADEIRGLRAALASYPSPIPRLPNCGRYIAQDNKGQWHYLNHAGTWQGYQGPALAAQEKPEPGVAVKAAKPFMYGIMEPDGTAYMDEVCVDLSADTLKEMIEEDEMTGYTVVPLYLHATPSPAIPDGWKLVPIVPTLEMKNAGWREIDDQGFSTEDTEISPIYRAMLAVAPSPDLPEGEVESASELRECECFGDSGLHASTYVPVGSDRAHCDLCGYPVRDDSIDLLTAVSTSPSPIDKGEVK